MSIVEREYRLRIHAMSVAEKVARSAEMFEWARAMIAREIQREQPGLSSERLKLEVALRLYGDEPQARALIEKLIARVSG